MGDDRREGFSLLALIFEGVTVFFSGLQRAEETTNTNLTDRTIPCSRIEFSSCEVE